SGSLRNSSAAARMDMSPGWSPSAEPGGLSGLILTKGGSAGSDQTTFLRLPMTQRLILTMPRYLPTTPLIFARRRLGSRGAECRPSGSHLVRPATCAVTAPRLAQVQIRPGRRSNGQLPLQLRPRYAAARRRRDLPEDEIQLTHLILRSETRP